MLQGNTYRTYHTYFTYLTYSHPPPYLKKRKNKKVTSNKKH
mgnify:CR=1 FL=1